ncbi:protein of unassigned function [Methylobacterium oryzae CBMB20]|uniref:Protein of unassigned function n=2 Tax=Methylobacterium oryzae TaxID=334852 RepID=A0A089NRT8_9HYPH|nr:protein of unassigned function [Methylobacterium oryzae CBMB20]
MVEGWMAHADRDALSTGGHNTAYEGAYKFITNYFMCNSS